MRYLPCLIVAVVICNALSIFAQTRDTLMDYRNAPIDFYQTKGFIFKENVYRKCDVEMNAHQLGTHLAQIPRTVSFGKSILFNDAMTKILIGIGQGFILWPLLQEIDNGDGNWTWAAIGAGCIVASIPFKLITTKKCVKAIKFYNGSPQGSSEDIELDLALGTQGVGVQLRF